MSMPYKETLNLPMLEAKAHYNNGFRFGLILGVFLSHATWIMIALFAIAMGFL